MARRIISTAFLSATILGTAVIATGPSLAETDFYKGRNVTMLIGSGAGGG